MKNKKSINPINSNEWKIRVQNLYISGSKEFKEINLLFNLNQ